jgi:CheY-like chemotaxis protein
VPLPYRRMTLSSLLVCADEATAQILRHVLEELDIRVESCPDVVRAGIRLAQQRFDVVILDCEAHADVTGLLRETRHSHLNDSILAVVVVKSQDGIREMFSLGVNFVLYKPVSHERALSSLRAARAVMWRDKRRSARASVHAHAVVDYANVEQEKATLVDLAADGMAVLFGKKLPPTSKVYFQFKLPGQSASVRLSGQILWQDWNGRAGIQFVDVPKASRRLLTEFLSATLPKASAQEPLSTVTVEMEERLQAVLVSVSPEAAISDGQHNATSDEVASQPAPTPDNRRGQARYACRLGAEVYRTGSPVPHRCCLTDFSPGGCYLEVHTPFPLGSTVEITVRTYDFKLRVSGVVQASHPGYGMGIVFELKTKDERAQVKKLTEMVAAAAQSE